MSDQEKYIYRYLKSKADIEAMGFRFEGNVIWHNKVHMHVTQYKSMLDKFGDGVIYKFIFFSRSDVGTSAERTVWKLYEKGEYIGAVYSEFLYESGLEENLFEI